MAIGKEKGTMILHINPLNHGGNSLLLTEGYKTSGHYYSRKEVEGIFGANALEQETKVEALDTLIKDPVKILKIDVEGFEDQVFEGMKRTLTGRLVENVICELGNKDTREATIHMMKKHGYYAYSIDSLGSLVEAKAERDLLFTLDKKEL